MVLNENSFVQERQGYSGVWLERERLSAQLEQAGWPIKLPTSNQQKLTLTGLQMMTKFLANLSAVLSRKRGQGFRWSGIAVGKVVFSAQENGYSNQAQDFLVARLAVIKIGGKTLAIPSGTLNQYSRLPDEIVFDSLTCHNLPGNLKCRALGDTRC